MSVGPGRASHRCLPMISYEPSPDTAAAADNKEGIHYPPQILVTVTEGMQAGRMGRMQAEASPLGSRPMPHQTTQEPRSHLRVQNPGETEYPA